MPQELVKLKEEAELAQKKSSGQIEGWETVNDLREKFLQAKHAKALIEEECQEASEEYENVVGASTDGLANISNPILFAIIQTKIAEELSSMPQVMFLPKKQEDVPKVEGVKASYYDSTSRNGFNLEIYKCFLSKGYLGTGMAREEYQYYKRTVYDRKKVDGVWTEVPREIVDKDDIVLSYVDIRRFFPDPNATDMNNCAWCFETEEMDYDTFLMFASNEEVYNQDNVKLVTPESDFDYNYPFGLAYLNEEEQKKVGGARTSGQNRVMVIKYFNYIEDKFCVIANGILIRDTPNPYAHKKLPYVRFVNYLELNSFWGRSEYKVIKQSIEEKNNFRNSMTDWSKININRPILLGQTDFEDEDVEFEAGAIWKVGDVNQLKMLDLGDIPNGMFGLEAKFDEDIVSWTGVDIRALLGGQDETATKTALKQEKALKRVGMGLRIVDWTALEPFAKMRLSNIQQFYSQKRVEAITDMDGVVTEQTVYRTIRVPDKTVIKDNGTIRFVDNKGAFGFFEAEPQYINAQVDIEAVPGSSLNASKEADRQNFNQFIQGTLPIPGMIEQFDMRALAEETAKKNNLDISKVLKKLDGETQQEEALVGSDMSTEQLLREQGVPRPGTGGTGGGIPEEVPTTDLLSALSINPPQNEQQQGEPVAPQGA